MVAARKLSRRRQLRFARAPANIGREGNAPPEKGRGALYLGETRPPVPSARRGHAAGAAPTLRVGPAGRFRSTKRTTAKRPSRAPICRRGRRPRPFLRAVSSDCGPRPPQPPTAPSVRRVRRASAAARPHQRCAGRGSSSAWAPQNRRGAAQPPCAGRQGNWRACHRKSLGSPRARRRGPFRRGVRTKKELTGVSPISRLKLRKPARI